MDSDPFGALRRVIGDAQLGSANDLVRRTLAQNGLMPDGKVSAPLDLSGLSETLTATLTGALAGTLAGTLPGQGAAAPAAEVPGASFTAGRFTCEAGERDYLVYVPASAETGPQGLVMMLHGCTQTHADFAIGTGMNALAEQHRLIVVYPQQARGQNAQSCWNWFSPGDQRRDRGEPAILAGLAQQAARDHAVPTDRVFVAGLSAGAAMAVILGQTHGDVFAAVGAHSGLPFGAARDVSSAFSAMAGTGPDQRAPAQDARPARTIVFHGSADRTVHPVNGERIAADVLNAGPVQTMVARETGRTNGRAFTREVTTTPEGGALLEHWTVEGLGHAWSGGRAGGSYTDPQGPDASAQMIRFFLSDA